MTKDRLVWVVGFIAALIAGWFVGGVGLASWSLTTIAALIIAAFLAAVYVFTRTQAIHDGQPMPPAQARFLALYLVSVCVGLVYLIFTLLAVRFPEPPANRANSAPSLPDMARPADGLPLIVQVVPDPLTVDMGPLDLQIFGFCLVPSTTTADSAGGTAASGSAPSTGRSATAGTTPTPSPTPVPCSPRPTPTPPVATPTPTPGAATPTPTPGVASPTPTPSGTPTAAASPNSPGRSGAAGPPSGAPVQTNSGSASGTIVNIGGVTKTPKIATEQVLVVPLDSNDIGTSGRTLSVSVIRKDGWTAQSKVTVLDQAGELHLLRWTRSITREMQLLLLVMFAGALGSYIHAIRSLTTYIGNQQAVASWFWFYVTRPFVGIALAIVFYAAIRGGFVAGSPADVKSVNPFGVFAIAALVGMFADKAGAKLAEIFDALFKSSDPANQRQNPSSDLGIVTASLPPATVGQAYRAKLEAKGGTKPYKFGVLKPAWLSPVDPTSGELTGTPPQAGTVDVVATVNDAATTTTSKTFALEVRP